jgi:hypothetical protein
MPPKARCPVWLRAFFFVHPNAGPEVSAKAVVPASFRGGPSVLARKNYVGNYVLGVRKSPGVASGVTRGDGSFEIA